MKIEETYEDSKSRYLSVDSFHTRRPDTCGLPNMTQGDLFCEVFCSIYLSLYYFCNFAYFVLYIVEYSFQFYCDSHHRDNRVYISCTCKRKHYQRLQGFQTGIFQANIWQFQSLSIIVGRVKQDGDRRKEGCSVSFH